MSAPQARRQVLEHAATRFGGAEQLAKKLGIRQRLMKLYLDGATPIPDALFLRLVDLLSEQWRGEDQAPPRQDPNAKPR